MNVFILVPTSLLRERERALVAVAERCVCDARTSGRGSLPVWQPPSGSTYVGRTCFGLVFSRNIIPIVIFK